MRQFALTGNIASGKSTVAALLAAHGATIIDADLLARDAVAPGTAELERLVEHFGTGVLQGDGTLDRAALRRR
ncbi:MAG: dephospho-CoA kinase, partial [Gemmatimonadota bacterium]|nr:dephospho-CoA kinase [Gemmatimonadota bacterium]